MYTCDFVFVVSIYIKVHNSNVHSFVLGPFRRHCGCDMFKHRIRTT